MSILIQRRPLTGSLTLSAIVLGSCAQHQPPQPIPLPPTPAIVSDADRELNRPDVSSTVVGGEAPLPAPPNAVTIHPQHGDITLNFPHSDVRVVAKAVLGDLLHLHYTVAQGIAGDITLVSPGTVSRSAILPLFEMALKNANLALAPVPGGYQIEAIATAQAAGPVAPDATGFGSELVALKFINADELKKLLDSVLPGVVLSTDSLSNAVTISGTSGQRASAHDLIKQFDVNWLRNASFALFVPQRTDARIITPELDKLINAADSPTRGLVKLIAMERMNGILAVSTQRQYLDDVRRWVEIMDRAGESNEPRLFVYRVQNGRSKDLAKTLNAAFGNGGGGGDTDSANNVDPLAPPTNNNGLNPPQGNSNRPLATNNQNTLNNQNVPTVNEAHRLQINISSDEVNNAVVMYGTPREYAVVEDALRKLDIPPAQVLIEAAITEVTLNDALQYGVQWNFQQQHGLTSLTQGATNVLGVAAPGLSFFYNNKNDISATISALQDKTTVKVISAPKIVVLNNQTAALQVGDQVPILTQTASNPLTSGGSGSFGAQVNSVEYKDTGIILKVTPRVNAGGLVLMDVAQEVSAVTGTGSTTSIASPTISTRKISTTVAVQDGQVIVLGGLFKDQKTRERDGIPFLSQIPVLGGLFGTTNNKVNRTELLVIIKPHVIRTPDDGRAITEELRAKLQTLEPFKSQGKIP